MQHTFLYEKCQKYVFQRNRNKLNQYQIKHKITNICYYKNLIFIKNIYKIICKWINNINKIYKECVYTQYM